jgi:hypothetical protein
MATETSTIRVSRATRDLLAEARRREAIWRSEREANRIDAQNFDAQAELGEWVETLDDGLS